MIPLALLLIHVSVASNHQPAVRYDTVWRYESCHLVTAADFSDFDGLRREPERVLTCGEWAQDLITEGSTLSTDYIVVVRKT
jgi:hypothetical protein